MLTTMATGTGVYFDGKTSARREVAVEAAPDALRDQRDRRHAARGMALRRAGAQSAPADVLRLGRQRDPVLARLDVRDPALAAKIDEYAHGIDRTGVDRAARPQQDHRLDVRRRPSRWSSSPSSGLPALVERLAPLIPLSVEHRIGVRGRRPGPRHAGHRANPASRSNAASTDAKRPAAPRSTS